VEFAASLPSSFKIRHFKGKYLLRRVAERYLPKELAWRRKHGFIVPWENWVRRPDNAALDGLLSSSVLRERGLFDLERLRLFRAELARGSRIVEAGLLFRVAVLGLWLESLERDAAGTTT
jgi:asparagine synthase (glutamine-hydrolysing)